MTETQWQKLLGVIDGEVFSPIPVGFIIDSPWLPGWTGISMLDYYASETMWFDANKKAVTAFPEIMFMPGFWSEYGMCTEPSAFGSKCVFHENEFPFAEPVLDMNGSFGNIDKPNPKTDGLAPFVLHRLSSLRPRIEEIGHTVKFAVARGPLNIAGFLMGTTEFLMAMKLDPDQIHALLDTITKYLGDWLQLQKTTLPTIDGILLLDDIVGFLGADDFHTFAQPYLTRTFQSFDAAVRFFHNDAAGTVCAPHLADIGVNMFNFSCDHSMTEMRALVGDDVTLVGNIPPRDVLAQGRPEDVARSVQTVLDELADRRRVILSCGGGMPPDVSTENVTAFLHTAQ
ncbi:MAG: uroporphyrinogen decarboxylase [Candidatus Hydrogenedentes bacterium]|nr:uroporphyrinogen decarboxylase [Candidatus Hydrogenedentota bacterium]